MKILADLHTHTLASGHGTTDTITDLAKEASKRGITLLGISDHGPASPGSAGISYFRSLMLAEHERFGIKLLYGAEANILNASGDLDLPDDLLETLDFVIISMHRPIYTSGSVTENTRAYTLAMKHPKVRIIGHCDDARFPVDYETLVHAAHEQRVLPELNNVSLLPDSYRKDCRSNSIHLLECCAKLHCPLILSSDSHGRAHLGDGTEAIRLVKETQFPAELVLNGQASLEKLLSFL